MRVSPVIAAILLLVGAPLPAVQAATQGDPPRASEAKPPTAERARAALDKLFERLAAARDAEEAAGIAKLIERRWLQSGSDTADLLMSRALAALAGNDQPLAVELLDRTIALQPDWAEAWHKRATLFFMMGDTEQAIADVRQTLAHEPRHFTAWAGLGVLFERADDKRRALEAYRRALALHPYLGDVRSAIDRLTRDVGGRDI
ncbi:tetratricopeptide repeat protein [Chelatococcus sp. SYSU_G07232]|uniref:Tetratricopeptide repeat protein n=1 Tax=Chelatococcus albus TaxID=3047466 RepID=A0ABT7AH43_9HYPH|nr:tetratricopeptide repeat protein [Chelatococcus sp. SYSU_G07232]MDJ1158302.1 tetratricopeptide repeat protein [Chelatococcus sp. SYSU_G07232]